jgi:hypothetical protein
MVNSFSDIIIFKNNGFPAFQTLNAKWLFDAGIQLDIPPAVYTKSCTKSVPGITSQNFGAYGETIVFFPRDISSARRNSFSISNLGRYDWGFTGCPFTKEINKCFCQLNLVM